MSNNENKLSLVVLELHHHAELIRNLYDILSLSDFRITLVTVPEIYEKTGLINESEDDALDVILKSPDEEVFDFFDRVAPVFRAADVVYFNTVRHYWRELNKLPLESVSIVRVHNAHCDLAPASHFYKPMINFVPIFFHLIRKIVIGGEWRLKKKFFDKVDHVMLPTQAITEYVRKSGWLNKDKILDPVLPFGYLGERRYEAESQADGYVTVAITGKVTNNKKDYFLVLDALKKCLPDLQYPLKLVLLGRANDKHAGYIVRGFKSLESELFCLDYSTEYVSSEAFEEKVSHVDFLISPIQVDVKCRKYHEIYGKSKMSGVENDMLVFRKPSLVVSHYPVSGELGGVVDYFDKTSDSLASKIKQWVNDRTFEDRKMLFEDMTGYRREVIADSFYKLCRDLVDNKAL